MDSSIFLILFVVAGILAAAPVIAIVALIRARSLSTRLDQLASDYRDSVFGRLRTRYAAEPEPSLWTRRLGLRYPEQWFFFAPVLLLAFLIAVKMNPGMVTLSWGVEGLLMILLGLGTSQRSYRLSGLLLLLLCVGKIVCLDAWRLQERDRYITFIVLGAALTLVSTLYNRYRETVRRLL